MYDAEVDPQQDRVYEAEMYLPEGRVFDTIEVLGAYISSVVNTRWVRNRGWNFRVWEARGSCGSRAWCHVDHDVCTFLFPRGTRHELCVMHEVAHALTFDGHGPEFCAMYLRCVRRFMGPSQAELLRREFLDYGVKHRLRKQKWATALDSIECDFFGG